MCVLILQVGIDDTTNESLVNYKINNEKNTMNRSAKTEVKT